MSSDHRRWICHVCQREWVYAHGWQESDGCPVCHSPRIEHVTYRAVAPGLDIRTQAHEVAVHDAGDMPVTWSHGEAEAARLSQPPAVALLASQASPFEFDDEWAFLS